MPKMFGMKFPKPVVKETIIFGTTTSVPVATTGYLPCSEKSGLRSVIYVLTESTQICNFRVTRAGVLRSLVVHSSGTPGIAETYVYTVRVNQAPTAITCTISGAASRDASDLVNYASVVVGDRVTLQVVTSAAAALSLHAVFLEVDMATTKGGFENIHFSSGITTIAANTTTFLGLCYRFTALGAITGTELSASIGFSVLRKGTLRNLVAWAVAAAGVGESFIYTLRVNTINSTLTTTISGAAQVTNTNIVNVVVVNPGDRITIQIITSLAAAVTLHAVSFDFEEGDYQA